MNFSTFPQRRLFGWVGLLCLVLVPMGFAKQIGDPGWTFDASRFDPRFPAMKEWAGIEGGIPLRASTPVVQTLSSVAGDTDMADNIQAAIDAAATAGGGVVLLKNGTYPIQSAIHLRNRVILRGQSPYGTILISSMRFVGGIKSIKINTIHMDSLEDAGLEDFSLIYRVTKDGQTMYPLDHEWTMDRPEASQGEHNYQNERLYYERAHLKYEIKDDLYVNFVRIQGTSCNVWIDNCRFLDSGSNLVTVSGEHITIRNCLIKGSFQKGDSGNGYGISCSGRYVLMTGNTVSKTCHWAIQQGAQYCVIYDNLCEVDINFHQEDWGLNLIEKTKIHLPVWSPWECVETGPSYRDTPKALNLFYNNHCVTKRGNRVYGDNQVYALINGVVQPLGAGVTPTGGTLYAVAPTEDSFYRVRLSQNRLRLVAGATQDLDIVFTHFAEGMGPQSFRIQREGQRRIRIFGGDSMGAMYGGLELAEMISLGGGLHAVEDKARKPYVLRRGLKFNISFDGRTPSYDDTGTAAQENIATMWDFNYWKHFLDTMVRNRYNVLSLWTTNPYAGMELKATLTDMVSMAHLGRYYADKNRGAADLAVFRANKQRTQHHEQTVTHLSNAVEDWQAYAQTATSQYKTQLLSRSHYLDWWKILEYVNQEVETVRQEINQ